VSGSLKVTGSIITTLGITGPINATNGVISSSAQLTALNTYTSSNDSVLARVLQTTASLNTTTGSLIGITNGLMDYTSSLKSVGLVSGSLIESSSYSVVSDNAKTMLLYSLTQDFESYLLFSNAVAVPSTTIAGNNNIRYNSSTNKLTVGTVSATKYLGGVVSGSAQLTELNTYTGSNDSVISAILQTTASLNTYTGSNDSVISRILQTTASLNTLTGSVSGIVNNLMSYTASLKAAAIVSSSQQITNYYKFAQTASANTFYGDQTITGSLAIKDSETDFLIEGNAFSQTYLTSNGAIVLNPGYGGVEMVGSYRELRLTDIYAAGFVNGEIRANNNIVSSSQQIQNYNLFSVTSSLNNYTGSNDLVVNQILQTTASLNSKTGSYITTGSVGLTQSITGSLAITGSLTISSGSITMPNRPGVRVYGAGGAKSAVTTLSGSYTIVDWQQSNAWDNSTGTFTAPIAGLYQVNVVVRTNSNTLGTIAQLIVFKNNTGGTSGTQQIMIEFGTNTTMNHTGGSTISKLEVGDTLKMVVAVGEISFDVNDNFSVAYIG
jgi:hypothetical protein